MRNHDHAAAARAQKWAADKQAAVVRAAALRDQRRRERDNALRAQQGMPIKNNHCSGVNLFRNPFQSYICRLMD
jgi:hypothetical protein